MNEHIISAFKEAQKQSIEAYLPKLVDFYRPFFDTGEVAEEFIKVCHELENDNRARRILHQIERLNGLADLMISTKKDALSVLFWIMSIESIYTTSCAKKMKKYEMIYEFFEKYISEKDQKFLLKHFIVEDEKFEGIRAVAAVLNAVRNTVVHEGIFWMLHFVSEQDRNPLMSLYDQENACTISMTREEMREIIIRGSINYLKDFLRTVHNISI